MFKNGMLQGVILAGGLGTRLRPITETIPKPLVDVAGRPFLEWQLRDLKHHGLDRVLLLTGYLGEQIQSYFGDGRKLGLALSYSQEPEPLGTGGALAFALDRLESSFFLLNGDSFLSTSFEDLVKTHQKTGAQVTVAAYDNVDSTPVINNLMIDRDGYILRYERNGGREAGFDAVDAGIYVVDKSVIDPKRKGEKYQLEELWTDLIPRRQVAVHRVKEKFFDIGTPERLKEFERKVRDYI